MGRWLRGLEIDLRSLGLFRIALGLVLVADLLYRLPLIEPFYTDQGVLPRRALPTLFPTRLIISLHLISGDWLVQLLLLLLGILFALGLTVGYRTRVCTVGSWVLLTSVHMRNPTVLYGGDAVLRLLLFWCMFVPLNARFSLDKALNPSAPVLPLKHLSPASVALTLQICGIYWYAASEKMHPVWTTEQSAVYYALMLDQFSRPLGKLLLAFPDLLRLMTTGTLLLEFLGPLLVISPVLTGPLRLLGVASFIALHAGLALTMRLDLFPWVCMAMWLVFLPAMFWDTLLQRSKRLLLGRLDAVRALVERGSRWIVPPPPHQVGMLGSLLVLTFLTLVTASFIGVEPGRKTMAGRVLSLGLLSQSWQMFAPYPQRNDTWLVMEGVTVDGRLYDVWNGGGPPTDAKPDYLADQYRNQQWLMYLGSLGPDRNRERRPYLGRYLCRIWNEHHSAEEHIVLVHINSITEVTPPPGQAETAPIKEPMWQQPCPQ